MTDSPRFLHGIDRSGRILCFAWLIALLPLCTASAAIPDQCRQLLVGTADSWGSSVGQVQRFERTRGEWTPAGLPMRVLFGKNGLAWGVGVAGQDEAAQQKVEGDRRAPAGVFALGRIFGDAPSLPFPSAYPYHQVTPADAWIENPENPLYNQHVRVDLANPPNWFKREQMKQKDPAHKWKLEIRHNAEPPIPGRGSAIFFHIQRGPNRTSAGCTTMPESDLLEILRWLDPAANPHYVLLPISEYQRLTSRWGLPELFH
ncbi:MAG: L,D-transpeptidase family protein [Chthoniobacterales bacterium]